MTRWAMLATFLAACGQAGAEDADRAPPWKGQYKLDGRQTAQLTAADVVGPDGVVYPNWTKTGVQGGIPDVPPVAKIEDFGGRAGDDRDDSSALVAACLAAGDKGGGVVVLGAGVYDLDWPVTIRHDGVVIRGQGAAKTRLRFRYALPASGVGFYDLTPGGRIGVSTRITVHCAPKGLNKVEVLLDGKQIHQWERSLHSGNTFACSVRGDAAVGKFPDGEHVLRAVAHYQDGATRQGQIPVVLDAKFHDARPVAEWQAALLFAGQGLTGSRKALTEDGKRGAQVLSLESTAGLAAGDCLCLEAPATERWKSLTKNACRWGRYRAYQVRIEAVDGRRVTLEQPLRIEFPVIDGSFANKTDPIRNCGVENLTLEQTEDLWITSVLFRDAWNCWARGVTIKKCGRFPVYGSNAKWCEIRDCVFDDAWFKGGGGTAYAGWDGCWDCLMEGVETFKLRHAPLFQWAASGNVIRKSVFHDSDAQWHSGWTHENLIELCEVVSIKGNGGYGYGMWASPPNDEAHGPNGPRNVVYNCEISSPQTGLWMGGMNENWLILYNRFTVGSGPGVLARQASFDHIIRGNDFELKDGKSPMVQLATPDCRGVDIIRNRLVGGNGQFVAGPARPGRLAQNKVGGGSQRSPRAPSIYEWQNARPAAPPTALRPRLTQDPLDPAALGCEEIVFVKRPPYSSDHYYTDINNGTSPDRFRPDNGIYIHNLRTRAERPVVTAADLPGGRGFVGKISLSFDARKILFDFRQDSQSGFRIWEVGTDGSGLRQVSFPPPDEAEKAARWRKDWHTDDIHPCYLPDGKIVFSSTRCEHTVLCGGSASLVAPGIHRMHADGSHIEALTRSPVSEFCPVMLDDGRILYHRWEYIDKGARVSKTIWAMNPDGSKPQEIYGVADDTTTIYMYPQPIPGDDHRLVCVGTCHYPQGGCFGAIMLIDYRNGVRARGPDPDEADYRPDDHRYAVRNITPHVFIERRTEAGWRFLTEQGSYVHDPLGQHGHLYTHPFPVNERQFLVSYKVQPSDHYKDVANAYAIYLIDATGRHQLVRADDKLSCWHPLPLRARRMPPQVPAAIDPALAASQQALCVVANIQQGMEGVAPGEVRWLRINEALPRYWSTGRRWDPSLSSSSWKAALWPRVQWGVVPVEADGSAHFLAPANRSVFFQALDGNFRELQRERTYVNYRPGEMRSCTGCHGQPNRAANVIGAATPLALRRPPSVPQPQPCDLVENGGDGQAGQVVHYPTDIQPILNAKCVSCHGAAEPAGELRLTGETTLFYNTSYEELAKREMAGPLIPEFTSFLWGDRGNFNGAYLAPKNLGCPTSPLIELLTDPTHPQNAAADHSRMLTRMELMILSRWVDTNYQFYGSYFGRQHPQWARRDPQVPAYDPADFRRKPTFAEATSFFAPEWHR